MDDSLESIVSLSGVATSRDSHGLLCLIGDSSCEHYFVSLSASRGLGVLLPGTAHGSAEKCKREKRRCPICLANAVSGVLYSVITNRHRSRKSDGSGGGEGEGAWVLTC